MSNITSLIPILHNKKRTYIAWLIVEKLMLDFEDDHLAKAMRLPVGRNNLDVVLFIIDGCYSSPYLAYDLDHDSLIDELIEQISIRVGFPL